MKVLKSKPLSDAEAEKKLSAFLKRQQKSKHMDDPNVTSSAHVQDDILHRLGLIQASLSQ